MANGHHGFWSTERTKNREEVRKSLRVVQGGKSLWPTRLDTEALENDPFLREHYLEGRRRPSSFTDSWKSFFMGTFDDLGPEAS
jgi:hypothetical protein